ncbi:hypothetical protein V1511DRAFT_462954 [Dipodascopsis uninucleata]
MSSKGTSSEYQIQYRGPIVFADTSDDESPFVICAYSIRSDSPSFNQMVVNLIATDGVRPYIARVDRGNLTTIRSEKNALSKEDWARVILLTFANLDTFPDKLVSESYLHPNIRLRATKSKKSYDVTELTHQNVLGTLRFERHQDSDTSINVLRWLADTVQKTWSEDSEILQLKKENSQILIQMKRLQDQMVEFLEEKKKSDYELLEKTRILLNSKKMVSHTDVPIVKNQSFQAHATEDESILDVPQKISTTSSPSVTPARKRVRRSSDSDVAEDVTPETPKSDSSIIRSLESRNQQGPYTLRQMQAMTRSSPIRSTPTWTDNVESETEPENAHDITTTSESEDTNSG